MTESSTQYSKQTTVNMIAIKCQAEKSVTHTPNFEMSSGHT